MITSLLNLQSSEHVVMFLLTLFLLLLLLFLKHYSYYGFIMDFIYYVLGVQV